MWEATLAKGPRKGKVEGWGPPEVEIKGFGAPTEQFGVRGREPRESGVSGWTPIRCSWKTRVAVEDRGLHWLESPWEPYVETSVVLSTCHRFAEHLLRWVLCWGKTYSLALRELVVWPGRWGPGSKLRMKKAMLQRGATSL